jgi:type IX secretion system PorP/SprF family membrane protein
MKPIIVHQLFLLSIISLWSLVLTAQQDAQFTQYMYNTIAVNPAYAGSRGVTSIFLLHRNQWVGLDGAPVTNNFAVHKPIANTALGYGISIINDRIGVSDNNTISADVSYFIATSPTSKLSFGMKFSANWLSVDFNRLTIRNPNDIILSQQNEIQSQFAPNVGAGLYWHNSKNYLGVSVPNLFETKRYNDNSSTVAHDKMHIYIIAGTVFDLNSDWKFKPALLTKLVQGAPLQIDCSANFLFSEQLTIGVAYRWNAAISGLVGFQVSDAWQIGYTYDAETTRLSNYNSGSHELFLRVELFNKYNKMVAPRFF